MKHRGTAAPPPPVFSRRTWSFSSQSARSQGPEIPAFSTLKPAWDTRAPPIGGEILRARKFGGVKRKKALEDDQGRNAFSTTSVWRLSYLRNMGGAGEYI